MARRSDASLEDGTTERRARLSPDRIFDVALGIVDAEGLPALTMRRLAAALDVVPTAIYWHVRTRDELLRGVLDRTMERVEFAIPTSGTWDDRARALCRTIREALIAHPNVFALAERFPSKSIGPVLSALSSIATDAGLGGKEAATAILMLQSHAIGSAWVTVHQTPPDSAHRQLLEAVTDDALRLVEALRSTDLDAVFERGLDHLIEGMRREGGRRRR